jgi:hypothetical protein
MEIKYILVLIGSVFASIAAGLKKVKEGATKLHSLIQAVIVFTFGVGLGAVTISYLNITPLLAAGISALSGHFYEPIIDFALFHLNKYKK